MLQEGVVDGNLTYPTGEAQAGRQVLCSVVGKGLGRVRVVYTARSIIAPLLAGWFVLDCFFFLSVGCYLATLFRQNVSRKDKNKKVSDNSSG